MLLAELRYFRGHAGYGNFIVMVDAEIVHGRRVAGQEFGYGVIDLEVGFPRGRHISNPTNQLRDSLLQPVIPPLLKRHRSGSYLDGGNGQNSSQRRIPLLQGVDGKQNQHSYDKREHA